MGREDEVHLDKVPDFDEVVGCGCGHRCECRHGCGCGPRDDGFGVGGGLYTECGGDSDERLFSLYAKVSPNELCLVEKQNTQQEYHHSVNRRLG
eukprot:14998429-Ditylum_brightwellii.AAC.1